MTNDQTAEQKKKLAAFLQNRMSRINEDRISKRNVDTPIPLSFAQQRLWFFDQLAPGNSAYNDPLIFDLKGKINKNTLESAINHIIKRHEVLRTTFTTDANEEPIQVIKDHLEIKFKSYDLKMLSAKDRDHKSTQIIYDEALASFDLQKGPLVRISYIEFEPEHHILQISIHHIIFDGWTLSNFLKELKTIYEALIIEQSIPLQELEIQYADFSIWQRQLFQGNKMENQIKYWKEYLKDANTTLEFPLDESRPNQWSFNGSHEKKIINNKLLQGIQQLGKEENTTLFTTLLAMFTILMNKYTDQEDIIIGSVNANRNRVEIEPLIGFFVNMLPIRTKLDSTMSFHTILQQVRINCLGAFANQDIPFEQLVKLSNVQRDASRAPLVQVTFSLQSANHIPTTLGEAEFEYKEFVIPTSKFDLSMDLSVEKEGLRMFASYNTDIFLAEKIKKMLLHFETLIEAIIDRPHSPISELSILPAQEKNNIIHNLGQNEKQYLNSNQAVHHIFENIVSTYPHQIAVRFQDEQISYEDLNNRANQLAYFIHEQGLNTSSVGICMDRSIDMIVSIIAILKSGAGYVPIDSSYPIDRIQRMIEDSDMKMILTQSEHLNKLNAIDIHTIEYKQHFFENLNTNNPNFSVNDDNLAYIIFTSGSTGTPKGVKIGQDALVNFIFSCIDMMDITPEDHILQFASLSFDVSVFEIFSALLSGAELYVDHRDHLIQPEHLTEIMIKQKITIVDLPPVMLTYLEPQRFPDLRLMFIGTEAFSGELVTRWQSPNRRFINAYGPTEATCAVTFEECHGTYKYSPPIGKPMPNQELYVLNKSMQLVPIGVPGELYISGKGLSQGYVNQENLNQKLFIDNPFSSYNKMYKTGDLVKWLPQGSLEYLGRIDNQVKIKGFRIELGEIAAVLYKHSQIKNVHIAVREDLPNGKGLVAYLVSKYPQQESPTNSALRSYLAKDLPNYMIPQYFEFLEYLPVNPSGKVDFRQLPLPDFNKRNTSTDIKPSKKIEKEVASIFEKILGVQNIIMTDNFFDLGGDSLQATQCISRLRNLLQIDISLQILFSNPSLDDLIQALIEIEPDIEEQLELLSILEGMSEADVKNLLQN